MKKNQLHLRDPILRYGFALAVAGACILLRYAMTPMPSGTYVHIFVYPAIIIVAILAGLGPAILTSVLASLLAEYYFTAGLDLSDWLVICVIIFTGFLAGWLADRLHKALDQSRRQSAALTESERRFRAITTASSDVIYRMSPDWSQMRQLSGGGFLADTGTSSGDWLDRYIPADEQPRVRARISEAIGAKSIFEMEHEVLQLDGTVGWAFSRAVPLLDENGEILEWFGAASNITDRKQAEDALRESEEKFRLLAENANAIIGIVQGKNFVYVNPYLEQVSEYSRDELLTIDLAKMLHPDYRQMVLERAAKRQMGQNVESKYQFIMITKSGKQRWMDFCAARIMYLGKPAIVGIALDITEAKEAENALRESEEKFRMLAENAGAIIGIMQGEKIIYANPYSQRASGYSLEELLNIDVRKLIHPDYQQPMMERARRRQAGEPIESHYEFVMVTKSGEQRWLDFSPIMITYRGKPAIVAIAFDITDRKKAEAAIVRIKEQLESKNAELEIIIGIVSHDLRAPLVNVRGFANEISRDIYIVRDTLQKMPSGENTLKELAPVFHRFDQSVHFISSSAEAMDNLALSLVSVARAGLSAIRPERIDMNEVMRKVTASIEIKLRKSGASINMEKLPPCYADKAQVIQIFTNLLDNAVKYLDPDRPGLISITGKIENDMASYCVTDNGIGIAPEEQQNIFNPYYQLHEKPAEGVGMGLTTVKRMVERNNGRIWLSSEKNKGSAFCILLPKQP